ncbi:GATA-type zinc finger protein 1 [Dissostichus eleginoides]|uniref:GATA-type zinc finger protein 1 n=1 Tax=Dissostichus eleginoides TaxID=100907 RepID=A0AAD9BMU5_DISEL|nr:GATA-type zinc finger protein 1 [Dissostichus eleginoides]
MSTRPRTQAAFIQGNQSAIEHEGSHSALVYLFQEVSKLASPIHNSFLDINSPSMWLHETSRQDSFKVQKEEEDAHSFQIFNSPCQHNLSCMSSYNQMKKVKEESHSNNVTTLVEPHLKCSSPWKVLSLINLQCERLLHVKDAEESDPKSVQCDPKLGHSIDESSTAAPDVADLGIGGDCVSVECTLRPSLLIYGRQEIPQGCVKDSKEESAAPSTQQWRTKTLRKQLHPRRSANIQDPDFQGVTFRMDTELDDNREQSRLLITSMYSKELRKSVRKRRLRTRKSQISLKTSSSDEETSWMNSVSKGKVCASCCTRKTPMWRDAEDGTPLCNACGIRYKKYRVRCVYCWHIPRKEGNSNSCCLKCGNFVRLTTAQRKQST